MRFNRSINYFKLNLTWSKLVLMLDKSKPHIVYQVPFQENIIPVSLGGFW
jgi:hypothetical protein